MHLVSNILQTILSKSSHVFKKSHSSNCRKYKMTLPFTFPLQLIAKREIEVSNGKASISCGKWNEIVVLIFECMLEIEVRLLEACKDLKRVVYELEDDRFRQIIKRFVNYYNGSFHRAKADIKTEELDEESRYFPPCMANLHQILRYSHRLSYESRYHYTLFLKDIGVPVDENISLWEEEYSKPHVGSTCTHEWNEKQKRYTYQIQHLYGLVGCQGFKTSHSCEKFIGAIQTKMDGGCPFQHLSTEDLAKAIPQTIMQLPDVEDIFKYKNSGQPQKACAVYLNCQRKISTRQDCNFPDWSTSKVGHIVSPLHYYNLAKRS